MSFIDTLDEENLDNCNHADAGIADRDWFWTTGRPKPQESLAGTLNDAGALPTAGDLTGLQTWMQEKDPYYALFRPSVPFSLLGPKDLSRTRRRLMLRFKTSAKIRQLEREIFGPELIF